MARTVLAWGAAKTSEMWPGEKKLGHHNLSDAKLQRKISRDLSSNRYLKALLHRANTLSSVKV